MKKPGKASTSPGCDEVRVRQTRSVLTARSGRCRCSRSSRIDRFLDGVRGFLGGGLNLFRGFDSGFLGGLNGSGSGFLGRFRGTSSGVLGSINGASSSILGGFSSRLGLVGGSGRSVLDGFLGSSSSFAGLFSSSLGGSFNLGSRLFAGRDHEGSGSEGGERGEFHVLEVMWMVQLISFGWQETPVSAALRSPVRKDRIPAPVQCKSRASS